MRKPGHLPKAADALAEAKAHIMRCPICGDVLREVEGKPERLSCPKHGYFTVQWSLAKKKVSVKWDFHLYLYDK